MLKIAPQRPSRTDANLKPKAHSPKCFPHRYVCEGLPKVLHGRAIPPGFWDGKIVVFVLRGDEAETILPRYGFDRNAPIGSVLGDGDSNGIVRFRL